MRHKYAQERLGVLLNEHNSADNRYDFNYQNRQQSKGLGFHPSLSVLLHGISKTMNIGSPSFT